MIRPSLPRAALVGGTLTLAAAFPLSAQRYSATATFQASVVEHTANLISPEYRAYGVMVGVERSGRWWSPHLWLQRYDLLDICREPTPGDSGCTGDGWSLSVGPSVHFLDSGRVQGHFLPQVGLDSRLNQEFTGGAGIHIGWDGGFFQPQVFGRFQTLRGWNFATVGVGMRLELFSGEEEGRPEPGGFRRE